MCGESRQEIGTGKENRKRRKTEGIPHLPHPFFYFLRILFFLFHAKIIKRSLSRKIFLAGKGSEGGRYFFRTFFLSSKFLWESVAAASFASIYPLGQRFFHFQNPFLVSRQEGGGGGLKFIGLRKKVLFFFSIFPFRGKREKRPSISKKKKVKVRKQKGAVFFVFDLRGKAKSAADAPK